jgi:hypothetical protein
MIIFSRVDRDHHSGNHIGESGWTYVKKNFMVRDYNGEPQMEFLGRQETDEQ